MDLSARLDRHPRLADAAAIAREMTREVREDRVTGLAAEVAFFIQLSLLPMLLILVTALGLLEPMGAGELSRDVEEAIVTALGDALGSQDGALVTVVRDLFAAPSAGVLTFGLVAALWSGSKAFVGLAAALDVVYDLDEQRGWLRLRRDAILLAIGSVVVVSLSALALVAGPLLGVGQWVADGIGAGNRFTSTWQLLQLPVAALLAVTWLATLLHAAPDHRTPWRSDLPGALLAAAWWLTATVGLRLYFELSDGANAVYGALGGLLSFALWLYLLVMGVLVGGELNQVLLGRAGRAEEFDSTT